MGCAPDPVIPMLDCCQTAGCFPGYYVYAERDISQYHISVEEGTGRTRYWLNLRTYCDPITSRNPQFPLTMSINRYNYVMSFSASVPYGDCTLDAYPNGFAGIGPGRVAFAAGQGPDPSNFYYLTEEISPSDIIGDLNRLLAIDFPVPGEHVPRFAGSSILVPVGRLQNFFVPPPGGGTIFALWPTFDSLGNVVRSALGVQGTTPRFTTQPVILGKCWAAGRSYSLANYVAASKVRINILGAYCIADDLARTCDSFNVGSTWTNIDILPPDLDGAILDGTHGPSIYAAASKYLDPDCTCPFS